MALPRVPASASTRRVSRTVSHGGNTLRPSSLRSPVSRPADVSWRRTPGDRRERSAHRRCQPLATEPPRPLEDALLQLADDPAAKPRDPSPVSSMKPVRSIELHQVQVAGACHLLRGPESVLSLHVAQLAPSRLPAARRGCRCRGVVSEEPMGQAAHLASIRQARWGSVVWRCRVGARHQRGRRTSTVSASIRPPAPASAPKPPHRGDGDGGQRGASLQIVSCMARSRHRAAPRPAPVRPVPVVHQPDPRRQPSSRTCPRCQTTGERLAAPSFPTTSGHQHWISSF